MQQNKTIVAVCLILPSSETNKCLLVFGHISTRQVVPAPAIHWSRQKRLNMFYFRASISSSEWCRLFWWLTQTSSTTECCVHRFEFWTARDRVVLSKFSRLLFESTVGRVTWEVRYGEYSLEVRVKKQGVAYGSIRGPPPHSKAFILYWRYLMLS
jgi:hypothetical protein